MCVIPAVREEDGVLTLDRPEAMRVVAPFHDGSLGGDSPSPFRVLALHPSGNTTRARVG